MVTLIIIAILYSLIAVEVYYKMSDYQGKKWERIWLSTFWIILVPLYCIWWLHNKL